MHWKVEQHLYPFTVELRHFICSLPVFTFQQLFHGPDPSPVLHCHRCDPIGTVCDNDSLYFDNAWVVLPHLQFFLHRLFLVSIVWALELCFAVETEILNILSLLRLTFWSMLRLECENFVLTALPRFLTLTCTLFSLCGIYNFQCCWCPCVILTQLFLSPSEQFSASACFHSAARLSK
jgi:hypothetical protein